MSTATAKATTAPKNGAIVKSITRKVENSIYRTTDYTLFKRASGNRTVSNNHVNRLKESMKENDLMIPIIVNEKMEVIDGQHRLQARTDLGLPVFYVIINGLGIYDTQKANANSKNWTGEDFLNFYCEQNYYSYKEFKKFREKYKFDMMACLAMMAGYSFKNSDFRAGELMVSPANLENAETLALRICQIGEFYGGYRRRSFIFAIMRLSNNEQFDFDEFINKLSYQSSKLVDCTSVDQYLRVIEDIYNYKRKVEERVRFR